MADPTEPKKEPPAQNIYTYIRDSGDSPLTLKTASDMLGLKPGRTYVFPPGLGGFPYGFETAKKNEPKAELPFVLFTPYKRPPGLKNKRDTVLDSLPTPSFAIALPLPSSALKTSYGVEYQPVQMGAEMELVAERFKNLDLENLFSKQTLNSVISLDTLKNIGEGMIAASPGVILSAVEGNKKSAIKQALMGAVMGAVEGSGAVEMATFSTIKNLVNTYVDQNMTNAVFASKGLAENPFTEQLFKGVSLRTFNYTFVFMPRNEQEAVIVDDILQIFKFYMLPAYTNIDLKTPGQNEINNVGAFFSYPYEFLITYSVQDTTFSLLPTALSNMSVTYNDGMDSPKFFVANSSGEQYPIKTTLTLTFTEVMILTRDKILISNDDAYNEAAETKERKGLSRRVRF